MDRPEPGRDARDPGLLAGEEGMISLSTLFVFLGFAVLIGLVGNVGQAVKAKIELQNAADAAAVSSATWMARGMNAATATNHLMGELTALVVIHEALGGPELGRELGETESSRSLTESIDLLSPWAPMAVGKADKLLVEAAKNRLNSPGWTRHRAGATLYDAKLTLKWAHAVVLFVKGVANVGYIPTPVVGITAPLATGFHIGMDLVIIKILQESFFIDFVEAGALAMRPAREAIWSEGGVIRALARHGDMVADQGPGRTPVGRSVADTLAALSGSHRASLAAFPTPDDLRLPVVPEPPPPRRGEPAPGSTTGMPATFGQPPSRSDVDARFPPGLREVLDAQDDIKAALKEWQGLLNALNEAADAVSGPFEAIGGGSGFASFKFRIPSDLPGLPPAPGRAKHDGRRGYEDNPSLAPESLPEIPWEAEATSQWTRATYPHVDSYRGSVRKQFDAKIGPFKALEICNASAYFVHWTNRYTLKLCHEIRSPGASSDPPKMYVIDGMDGANKGREPWTWDDRLAERRFTLMGFAHRPAPAAVALPPLFRDPSGGARVAMAQALLYNAGGRRPSPPVGGATQPDTGWDTLNWAAPVRAPEWGAEPTSGGPPARPWEILSGGRESGPSARVRLDWQAKLVPITPARLGEAADDPGLPGALRKPLRFAVEHADAMISH